MKTLYLRNAKKGFATNSSSYHSTMIFTKEEYDKWVKGQFAADISYDELNGDYGDDGYYRYVESEAQRTIDGKTIIAITYCEEN